MIAFQKLTARGRKPLCVVTLVLSNAPSWREGGAALSLRASVRYYEFGSPTSFQNLQRAPMVLSQ
eukprot:5582491-Amphidinium_carterae.1